jgi:ribonuclease I
MNMSKIGRARAQALGAKKAPSQQPHKHWAPRHNNQTGSFTQTPFPFFLMMLSWCPVLALGAKKRYGHLLQEAPRGVQAPLCNNQNAIIVHCLQVHFIDH